MYQEIVASPTYHRNKSGVLAWRIPQHLTTGPQPFILITIQLAFIRPDHTLIFVDHNALLSFHIIRRRQSCLSTDFSSNSQVSISYFK